MKPATEQALATLELIIKDGLSFRPPYHEDGGYFRPYVWDSEQNGVFSTLSLIKSAGWIEETDIELAIKNWQWSEQTGLAAPGILNDGEPSCIEDDEDEEEILLDEETKLNREKIYQNLFELLLEKVNNLQAFVLSCDRNYSLSVLIGQIDAKKWIALSSIVPQETPFYFDDEIVCKSYVPENNISSSINSSDLEREIQGYINQLSNIKVYGWYDGGYNHTHEYKIVFATGSSKEQALENILLESKLLEIYQFNNFVFSEMIEDYDDDEAQEVKLKSERFSEFLGQAFSETLLYRFCFWDYEHLYILGELNNGDKPNDMASQRAGIDLHSQFTFNP